MAVKTNTNNGKIIKGTSNADEITNSGYIVTISGGKGNDTILNNLAGKNSSLGGGKGNDSIRNNADNVTISGGNGNDTLVNDVYDLGESQNVSIYGGAGNDLIQNFGKYATIVGGKGNDTLSTNYSIRKDKFLDFDSNVTFKYSSGDGNDKIIGFRADSTLKIDGGSYSTKKSGSNIIVTVGKGKISLMGAASLSAIHINNDVILTDSTKSPVIVDYSIKNIDSSIRTTAANIKGSCLDNSIVGGSSNDSIYGRNGDDTILGNAGNDELYGGNGDDVLKGGKGNDSLWGDAGNDSLWGGKGNDTFIFKAGDGKNTIFDYSSGDMLKILKSDGSSGGKFSKSSFSNGTLTLTISGGGQIVLNNVSASDTFNINSTNYKISGSKLVKS